MAAAAATHSLIVVVVVLVLVHHTPVPVAAVAPPPPPPAGPTTVVSIDGTSWQINGRPTHAGSRAEGLLPNARMIQGVFDDANAGTRANWAYPDTTAWDPARNTREFVGNMSAWKDAGLLAFTVGLQGGSPHCYGNAGWTVSAFDARTGALDPAWAARLLLILRKADRLGMVVIVQFFYSFQYMKLSEAAQTAAVAQIAGFLLSTGLLNFVIDAFNERCDAEDAARITEIHRLAAAHDPPRKLLVASSCPGGQHTPAPEVVAVSDFVLIHGNGEQPAGISQLVGKVRAMESWRARPMPIVFNEDDHGNLLTPSPMGSNLEAAIAANTSWGFLCCCDGKVQGDYSTGYQCPPVDWRIAGGGLCLSGPQGRPMVNGSKADWGVALRRITAPLAHKSPDARPEVPTVDALS